PRDDVTGCIARLAPCTLSSVTCPASWIRTRTSTKLIDAYFADQKIIAISTERLRREHVPLPKGPKPGYDGRLSGWLTEMLNYGPPDGPERAWPLILRLIDRGPDVNALGWVGAGEVEDLVNRSGAAFADRIIDEAAKSRRFRAALRHVWPNEDVPNSLQTLIRDSRAGDTK
ncbi:MAG TPA: hypothetical protein VHM48_14390, partial [Candidatus Limnocylindrales bacterium]|nr:hypothetical protein [Candidatus Limnocylindrales bacterium]